MQPERSPDVVAQCAESVQMKRVEQSHSALRRALREHPEQTLLEHPDGASREHPERTLLEHPDRASREHPERTLVER